MPEPAQSDASVGSVAVTVDANLFKQKTHTNPLARLVEPVANGARPLPLRSGCGSSLLLPLRVLPPALR